VDLARGRRADALVGDGDRGVLRRERPVLCTSTSGIALRTSRRDLGAAQRRTGVTLMHSSSLERIVWHNTDMADDPTYITSFSFTYELSDGTSATITSVEDLSTYLVETSTDMQRVVIATNWEAVP
jgi:hypothetical protein